MEVCGRVALQILASSQTSTRATSVTQGPGLFNMHFSGTPTGRDCTGQGMIINLSLTARVLEDCPCLGRGMVWTGVCDGWV